MFLLFLLFCPALVAAQPADSFIVLGPNDAIPQNRFIYALLNADSGELALGYANRAPTNVTRRVASRLPGHTELLVSMRGWSEADLLAALNDPVLRSTELGHSIGGGFVATEEGIMIHPHHSFKAAGELEPFVDPLKRATINPLRPHAYPGFIGAHATEADSELLLQAISERTGGTLKMYRKMDTPLFPWNRAKQGALNPAHISLMVGKPGDYLDQMADRVNYRRFAPATIEASSAGGFARWGRRVGRVALPIAIIAETPTIAGRFSRYSGSGMEWYVDKLGGVPGADEPVRAIVTAPLLGAGAAVIVTGSAATAAGETLVYEPMIQPPLDLIRSVPEFVTMDEKIDPGNPVKYQRQLDAMSAPTRRTTERITSGGNFLGDMVRNFIHTGNPFISFW